MDPMPTLTTGRLVLRPLAAGDVAALFPIFADAETMRWWSTPPFESAAALAAWLAEEAELAEWAVCLDEQPVGRIVLRTRRRGVMELGYLLSREHWGQGLGREALAAVIAHGFGTLGLRRIFADVDPDNAASIGLLAALGFALEGRLRAEWETPHQGVRDSLIFGLLSTDRAA